MNEKRCPSCCRFQPLDRLRRKKLPHGRVRLICLACIERARTRSDVAPDFTRKEPSHEA